MIPLAQGAIYKIFLVVPDLVTVNAVVIVAEFSLAVV